MKEPQTKPTTVTGAWHPSPYPLSFLLLLSSSFSSACPSSSQLACFYTCLQLSKAGKCFFSLQAVHLQRGKTGRHHGELTVNGSGRKVQQSKIFKCWCLTWQMKTWANRWLMSSCIHKSHSQSHRSLLCVLGGVWRKRWCLKVLMWPSSPDLVSSVLQLSHSWKVFGVSVLDDCRCTGGVEPFGFSNSSWSTAVCGRCLICQRRGR